MVGRGVLGVVLVTMTFLEFAQSGNPDAKRLYDDLLSHYNKLVRPVVNTSDILKVRIKLRLSQLIDVVSWEEVILLLWNLNSVWVENHVKHDKKREGRNYY